MKIAPLKYWIIERHRIYLRRARGLPWPWTEDKILRTFRFCNVFRELDTVTIWIREHIREPYADHPMLWFMMAAARTINWPPTLQELMEDRSGAWPRTKNWTPDRMETILAARQRRGEKMHTGAYMVRSDPGIPKSHYIAQRVLGRLWRRREEVAPVLLFGTSLREATRALAMGYGWAGFTSYEVVTDLRHCPGWLDEALDIHYWANLGPGARRGLNRLYGYPLKRQWSEANGVRAMETLQRRLNATLPTDIPRLEMRDVEHSLCETDKYLRVQNNEGRPRSLYSPPNDERTQQ